jgi:DNA-binding transcriptional ArsR family regulator
MMTRERALAGLSALASETRLDLVRLLVVAGEAGLPAGVVAERLGISASRLSFHLSALEQARLVTAARDGRRILYRADHAGIGGIIGYLLHDCCAGHPEVCACTDRVAASAAAARQTC